MESRLIYLDFETRSECDLKKCGANRYAEDPSTDILCMAAAIDDGDPILWIPGNRGLPRPIAAALEAGHLIFAHNAGFERAIWAQIGVLKYGWPEMPLIRWRCTAARCAALALPRSLDGAAKAIGLDHTKDMDGHRLMLRMCKPLPKSMQKKHGKWDEDPSHYERLYAYCIKDVAVETALYQATGPLSDLQVSEWLLDQIINDRGVPVDLETIDAAIEIDNAEKRDLESKLSAITGGSCTSGKQTQRIMSWLIDMGVNLGNLQKTTIEEHMELDYEPEVLDVLSLRKSLSLSSTAKYSAMKRMACSDGRVRGVHMYHGASTGRWSGKGVQFQNVPRGNLKPREVKDAIESIRDGTVNLFYRDVPGVLSSCLRGMVQASPGKKLIVCDFAGIEARVLAWVAKERHLLETFRAGEDVYVKLASKIYNIPQEDVSKDQRFIGKTATLGLGYQMGPKRFVATVAKFGREITDKFGEDVVQTFRESNPNVTELWYKLDRAVRKVINKKDEVEHINMLRIYRDGRYLNIDLPSGRKLSYYNPKLVLRENRFNISYMGVNSVTRKWERLTSYGGKFCENVVQAIARDLLVSAMFRLEAAGYETIFHVHDEVVIEADHGSIEEVNEIMCRVPKWAMYCPIDGEGYESERYRK